MKNITEQIELHIEKLGIQKLKSVLTLLDKKNVKRQVDLKGLIVQIRGAQQKSQLEFWSSDKGSYCIYYSNKFILSFLKLLKEQGFIHNYYVIPKVLFSEYMNNKNDFTDRLVIIFFNYDATAWNNSLRIIKLVSTSSRIVYTSWMNLKKLPNIRSDGSAVYILSTNKGLMTHLRAQQEEVGGKILCIIK